MDLPIFYSWQSDLPLGINCDFIERCLVAAAARVQRQLKTTPKVQRDISGLPGTPDGRKEILERIKKCAIFVPDVSIVDRLANGRAVCNPNVQIEFGMAKAAVGEARIVAVMNTWFGEPRDLPFDIGGNIVRATYALSPTSTASEQVAQMELLTGKLAELLEEVLRGGALYRGLSDDAVAIASVLARNSKNGKAGDPTLTPEQLIQLTTLSRDRIELAIDELEGRNSVERLAGGGMPLISISPGTTFFLSLDSRLADWFPEDDARLMAQRLAKDGQVSAAEWCAENGWSPRRTNPALDFLTCLGLAGETSETSPVFSAVELSANGDTRLFAAGRLPRAVLEERAERGGVFICW